MDKKIEKRSAPFSRGRQTVIDTPLPCSRPKHSASVRNFLGGLETNTVSEKAYISQKRISNLFSNTKLRLHILQQGVLHGLARGHA